MLVQAPIVSRHQTRRTGLFGAYSGPSVQPKTWQDEGATWPVSFGTLRLVGAGVGLRIESLQRLRFRASLPSLFRGRDLCSLPQLFGH